MAQHDCAKALREILSRACLESREISSDEIDERFSMMEVTDCMPYVVTVSLSDVAADSEKLRSYTMSLMICVDAVMTVFMLRDQMSAFNDTQIDALAYLIGTYLSKISSPTSCGKMMNCILAKHPSWSSSSVVERLLRGSVLKSKPFDMATGEQIVDSDEDDADSAHLLKNSVYFQS